MKKKKKPYSSDKKQVIFLLQNKAKSKFKREEKDELLWV